jgi:hypothetical protein
LATAIWRIAAHNTFESIRRVAGTQSLVESVAVIIVIVMITPSIIVMLIAIFFPAIFSVLFHPRVFFGSLIPPLIMAFRCNYAAGRQGDGSEGAV